MKKILGIAVALLTGLSSFAQDTLKAEFNVVDVCDGEESVFTNTTKIPNKFIPCTFHWTLGDGTTSTDQFPKHTYTLDDKEKSQSFTVKLIVRSQAVPTAVDSAFAITTMHPNPDAFFTWKVNNMGNTQEVTVDSQTTKDVNNFYQWTLASVLKSNDVTPVFEHEDVKDYLDGTDYDFTLYLRTPQGCEDTYTTELNYNPLSVKDVVVDQGMAYPNPSTGTVYLKHVADKAEVFDLTGKEVFSTSESTSQLDLELESGVYLLKTTRDQKNYLQRIVIN